MLIIILFSFNVYYFFKPCTKMSICMNLRFLFVCCLFKELLPNNIEQELHSLAWRHYGRYFMEHGEIDSPPYVYTRYSSPHRSSRGHNYNPPQPFVPPLFTMADSLRETVEGGLEQNNVVQNHNNEPKGLSQRELNNLPSYFVTKKTLEEFNERFVRPQSAKK